MPAKPQSNGRTSIRYGRHTIEYEVREHETSRLKIEVHPDLRVIAHVPVGKNRDEVQARVHRRARWIVSQTTGFSKYHPLPVPKKYRSGESIFYLGLTQK